MKKKILYVMGVDWNWIYQRPHIIAEKLNNDYDVTLIFPRSILEWKRKRDKLNINHHIMWTIPFQEKNILIGFIAKLFQRRLFKAIQQYDIVYIGYPLYYRYLSKRYKGKVIYDCMDNFEAIYPDKKGVDKLIRTENQLLENCDKLIVTSEALGEKISNSMFFDKMQLVRNAVDIEEVQVYKKNMVYPIKIGYIGTIAEWFDFEILEYTLDRLENLEYGLIGPFKFNIDNMFPRLDFLGTVDHVKLYETIKNYSCMIMPFKVNDIVKYVDPVKIYEYISFGKCIVSVYYPELNHFSDFVYFYETKQDLVELLIELRDDGFKPKYNSKQQNEFLKTNSWDARYEDIKAIIKAND